VAAHGATSTDATVDCDSIPQADLLASTGAQQEASWGLYWAGGGGRYDKARRGVSSSFYDPARPTVIFVHGWAPLGVGSTPGSDPMRYREGGIDADLPVAWRTPTRPGAAAWNVGLFLWTPFADELEVKDAEAKIWSPQGPRGMRWRKLDGSYSTVAPNRSVGELFYTAFVCGLADFRGSELRVAGFSLGAQLAVQLAERARTAADLRQLPPSLVPTRVALLDPAFTKGDKDYLGGSWTGERVRTVVHRLRGGMLFEEYKTTVFDQLGITDQNLELRDKVAYVELEPNFLPFWNQVARHGAAPYYYFAQAAVGPARRCGSAAGDLAVVPSAPTPNAEIRSAMDGPVRWIQSQGLSTASLDDDCFVSQSR
jgi:hypothetical protein